MAANCRESTPGEAQEGAVKHGRNVDVEPGCRPRGGDRNEHAVKQPIVVPLLHPTSSPLAVDVHIKPQRPASSAFRSEERMLAPRLRTFLTGAAHRRRRARVLQPP